jgi:hypothetical protein
MAMYMVGQKALALRFCNHTGTATPLASTKLASPYPFVVQLAFTVTWAVLRIADHYRRDGTARNTVRTPLQQVMDKMACTRPSEVTALLSNVALVQGATVTP